MFTVGGHFHQSIKDLIKRGQNDAIKSCFKGVVPAEFFDSSKTYLLHLAAEYNNCDLTKYLINVKCNVNVKNAFQATPLMVAATNNSFKTAQLLIEANADLYATNSTNKTALELLLNNKNVPQYLIISCLKKVESDLCSDEAIAEKLFLVKCPINYVIRLKKPNVTRLILKYYGQANPLQSRAAMDLALRFKDHAHISVLLECGVGVDINFRYAIQFLRELRTSRICDEVKLNLINAFLERVRDWNHLSKDCLFCLQLIFKSGTREVIQLVLHHGVNDHVKNQFPGQDLCIDLFGNDCPEARELLNHQIFDVNARGQDGFTALHYAVSGRNLDYVRTLLEAGANPNAKNVIGHVPLAYIDTFSLPFFDEQEKEFNKNFNQKILDLLLQAGADPQLAMAVDFDLSQYIHFDPFKLEMLLAQLAINESMGVPIRQAIRQVIKGSLTVLVSYDKYRMQLEQLKAVKIHGFVTLYTIITTDPLQISNSVHNREVIERIALNSDVKELNYYYRSKLRYSVNQILRVKDLQMKASAFLCDCTGWPYSQYLILEKIISYLSHRDLLVFEYALQ